LYRGLWDLLFCSGHSADAEDANTKAVPCANAEADSCANAKADACTDTWANIRSGNDNDINASGVS
jgi:hypothetical protein